MAEIKAVKAKPDVELRLTWDEFEAIVASVAVASPTLVVDWILSVNPDTVIQDNGMYHQVVPFETLDGFVRNR